MRWRWSDVIDGKEKEKVEEKKKKPIFIRGVELVDLDDYNVLDMKLHCHSNDTDENDVLNPKGMNVGDGGDSSSQSLEPNLGPATEPVPSIVPIHSERPSEATASVLDPLFNAAGKAPHLDAMIV
jgi:hypothetical protein